MTKHEKQIIKVLKALSENTFNVAKTYEKGTTQYRYNMSACNAYEIAIRIIQDKEALKVRAEIFNVNIEEEIK